MKASLLCAFVLAAALSAAMFQASPAAGTYMEQSGQDALRLARKEPEPPAHPDFDSPEPFDRGAAA